MKSTLAVGRQHRPLGRFQRLESRRLLAGDLTNPHNPLDVNDDQQVTASDALSVINYLSRMQPLGEGEPAGATNRHGQTIFPDTSGNGVVAASDALRVINALAEGEDDGPSSPSAVFSIYFDTGSSPKVSFSGQHADVRVSSPQSGQLRFEVGDVDRTITIKHDLHIEAAGNHNRWYFDGARIPDDLLVKFKGSDNALRLFDTWVDDDFIFHGGPGSDAVIIDGGSRIRDDAVIKTKDGDDLLVTLDSYLGDDLIYHAGDGSDGWCGSQTNIGDDAIARMGDHNDEVSLQDIQVRDVADIKGGHDYDSLAVSQLQARRYRPDDFERVGSLGDCQALIDEVFRDFGEHRNGTGNGYENGYDHGAMNPS